MRCLSMSLVAILMTSLGPAPGRGEEVAADASASRPRMTSLEPSGSDPLANLEKQVKRKTTDRRSRRRGAAASATAIQPGPLVSDVGPGAREAAVERGLKFLIATQGKDGGWNPQATGDFMADIATTSIAGLALLKARTGDEVVGRANAEQQAASFVVRQVKEATTRGEWQPAVVDKTVSNDLGEGSDAALAVLYLAEHLAAGGDQAADCREAVRMLMVSCAKRLNDDPTAFQNVAQGLSRAIMAHAVVVAGQAGVPAPADLMGRLVDGCTGNNHRFYGRAARIGCLHAAALQADARPPGEALALADTLVRPVLDDYQGRWPYGLGGEVFLSLLFLGAMLSDAGTQPAAEWSRGVEVALVKAQNRDGTWMGSSCINSSVFCTASALLVLDTASSDCRIAAQ